MASQRSSVDVERRSSVRTSVRLSMRHDAEDEEIDEEDDYDLAAAGIADGFRPSNVETSHDQPPHPQPPVSSELPVRGRTPPPRPSSISKPKDADSFALRHDGAMGTTTLSNANPSSEPATVQHARVISNSMDIMRPESPYRGPAGPSHPYHMYPQASGLARSSSVTTASTVPGIDRSSYMGPRNPTHPYGMYPQNIDTEADTSTVASVPVILPGSQPALRPEGQEASDIAGYEAPAEQLPPYTKYPDASLPRKAEPEVAPRLAGAGGIGLATRNPEFSSQEDLSSPRSARSESDGDSSDRDMNPSAVPVSEKVEPRLKKWQALARRRVCGVVPIWALVLAGSVVVVVALIVAAVLATILPDRNDNATTTPAPQTVTSWAESVTVFTTTFDATIFPSMPTGLPPLPTGTYALPITTPAATQNTCINDPDQLEAWSCQVPEIPLQMVIDSQSGSKDSGSQMIIQYQNHALDAYPYGAQPPAMRFSWALSLVSDYQDPEKGPAWFFQCPYDKLVILPENALNYTYGEDGDDNDDDGNGKSKRNPSSREVLSRSYSEMGVAQPGDKPWFCYWNGTLLEAFIYVNHTDTSSSESSSVSTPTGGTLARRHYPSTAGSYSTSEYTSTYASSTPSHTDDVSTTRSSPTVSQSHPTAPAPESEVYSASSAPEYPPAASPTYPTNWKPPQFLSPYPKPVKVEERRIPKGPDSAPPYCLQHVIEPDGSAKPHLDPNGGQTVIWLDETDPTYIVPIVTGRSLQGRVDALDERQASCSCGCVWVSD
ncbi:hypothetical protein F5884DRAFT_370352 [Xylogone sp. PMI_703]|nr:hypothetical protein F5884DRAFT_370352 [Xylogone sp. PMI_703]